jgi:hypothetical protein
MRILYLDLDTLRMMAAQPFGKAGDPFDTVIREGGPSHVRGALPRTLARLEGRRDAARGEFVTTTSSDSLNEIRSG